MDKPVTTAQDTAQMAAARRATALPALTALNTTRLYLLVFFLLLYMLFTPGGINNSDGEARFKLALSLVEHGSWSVPPTTPGTFVGADGKYYVIYGPGQSLLMVPFIATFKVVETLFNNPRYIEADDRPVITFLLALLFFPLFGALTMVVSFNVLQTLGYTVRSSLAAVLLVGTGSMFWYYSTTSFEESQLGFFVMASLWCLIRGTEGRSASWYGLSGGCLGIALLMKPPAAVYAVVFGGYLVYLRWQRRGVPASALWWFTAPVALLTAFDAYYNYVRLGSLLGSAYAERVPEGVLSGPFWRGLYIELLSAGESVVLYNPALLLAGVVMPRLLRGKRALIWVCVLSPLLIIALYAKYYGWTGEMPWGPRFLAHSLPFWTVPFAEFFEGAPIQGWLSPACRAVIAAAVGVQVLSVVSADIEAEQVKLVARREHRVYDLASENIIRRRIKNVAFIVAGYLGLQHRILSGYHPEEIAVLRSHPDNHHFQLWPLKLASSERAPLLSHTQAVAMIGAWLLGLGWAGAVVRSRAW